MLALALWCAPRGIVAGELSGPQVKAWFVVNFVKYTDWPGGRPAIVQLCTLGQDATVSALAALEGHSVGATTIRIKTAVTMVEAASCQVMYIADSEARRVSAILGSLAALPILTVSEIDGFIDQGGMIGLVAQDDRYVFEINLDAAHALGGCRAELCRRHRVPGGAPCGGVGGPGA